jgi:hypothetical protein
MMVGQEKQGRACSLSDQILGMCLRFVPLVARNLANAVQSALGSGLTTTRPVSIPSNAERDI